MKNTWVKIAIENGGVMTVSRKGRMIRAKMIWSGKSTIAGDFKQSIEEAIESLDSFLEDDAADEMIEAGSV